MTDAGDLLSRISNEMVQAQKAFFGNAPTAAKSYILDDMLFVVMRGGFTTAEMTMLEFGHADLVRKFRQIFENEMGDALIGVIEELTGRKVLTYQSQVLFDPNIALEVFVFDNTHAKGAEATARSQASEKDTSAATDQEPSTHRPKPESRPLPPRTAFGWLRERSDRRSKGSRWTSSRRPAARDRRPRRACIREMQQRHVRCSYPCI